MAFNSEDLTVDFKALKSITVSDRIAIMQQSPTISNEVLSTLTPIQIAQLFPSYYKKALPDVSNFVTANIQKQTSTWNQTGGGTAGNLNYPEYTQETKASGAAVAEEIKKSKIAQILEKADVRETVDGVAQRDEGARGRLGYTQDTTMDPRKRALLDAIATDSGGGYGTVNYVARGRGVSDVSDLSQGHPFITADGKAVKGSTASGRYQMLATNYVKFANQVGAIDPKTGKPDFSPEAQDKVAFEMAKDVYKKGTGGRSLEADLNDPNINPDQLIRPLSIDYGWWILKDEKGMDRAKNVFTQNLKTYDDDVKAAQAAMAEKAAKQGLPEVTATPELMKTLESDPDVQKYFAEKPEMAVKLQESINSGKLSVKDVSDLVSSGSEKIIDSKVEDKLGPTDNSPVPVSERPPAVPAPKEQLNLQGGGMATQQETAKIDSMMVPNGNVPTFRTGGTPYTQDDENLSVIDESGNLRWKMNSGEGVSIKPESNQYADEKLDELSGKIDEISKQFETGAKQPQSQTSAASRPTADKLSGHSDTQWAKNAISGYKPAGTQQRAFSRAQFRNEGRHIGDRGSPNIS